MRFAYTLLLLAGLALAACQDKAPVTVQDTAVMALFLEQEMDVEPYQTRIIVTKDYLRMDDGEGSLDFVLLDRKAKLIYSVNSDNQTVMSVLSRKVDIEPPFKLELEQKKMGTMQEAPTIAGKIPEHFAFFANGEECYQAILVKGFLPEMVAAMQEFHNILAGDSAITFNLIPADMHNACDMAGNTFAPARHLALGFPMREWKRGYARELVDFKQNYTADPALFELPADYFQFTVQDMREGKVKLPDAH